MRINVVTNYEETSECQQKQH